jgi:hypothetical protein
MTMTTDTAKLRELLAAGTQGEWSVTDEHEILSTENRNDPIDGEPYQERTLIAQGECSQNWGYIEWFNLADAALIVSAVNALPALLDEVEGLRAALSRLLLEFDFLIEEGTLPDIRDDMIFVAARTALGETK